MERKIAHEGLTRREENQKLKDEMCVRMDEGSKLKKVPGNWLQSDSAMKEEIRQIKLGSGSTVCSATSTAVGKGASGTFARPPPGIAARCNETFVPRKMEFKGWVTDYTRSCYQG